MRLLSGVCVATSILILDALVLNSVPGFAQTAAGPQDAGPRFRADGPNADVWGQKEGYPSCKGLDYIDRNALPRRCAEPLRHAVSCAHHRCSEAAGPTGARSERTCHSL